MNLGRRPDPEQVIDLDLLICTGLNPEHVFLFLCHIFTQRPMNNRKIERSSGVCFGWQKLLANSPKFSFHMKKKIDLPLQDIYKALKPFWLSNWVSIARVVARFSQASLSRPAATAANQETPCVWSCQSCLPKLCRSAAPRALPLILQSKPSIVFWMSRWPAGNSNLNSAAWPTGWKCFIC